MTKQSVSRARRQRRRALPLLLVPVLLAMPLLAWDAARIQAERIEVVSDHLPAAFDGFTIVQISDVHNRMFGRDSRRLLDAVAAQKPDLIAVTGDLINRDGALDFVPVLAEGLAAIAPTYYVTGNHEWASGKLWTLKPLLNDCGVTVLENEYVLLTRGGDTLALAGVEDPNGRAGQKTPGALMEELRADLGDEYTLLLAHRNNNWKTYDHCGADLTLSGHAHGGVVRFPFTEGLLGHRGLFPEHTAGLYTLPGGGAHMVSRGLGGVRLFNRPHLPVLVLRCGPAT